RRKSRNKAGIAVITSAGELLTFRIPGDHSLRTNIFQHLNAAIRQLQKRGSKGGFAFIVANFDLAEVHRPAARIAWHVDLWPCQKDRPDGAVIVPVHLEWILLRITLQGVSRQILHLRTCRAKAQRSIKCLASARLDVAASDYKWITGSGREIRRIGHAHSTLRIIAAKIERPGSGMHWDNGYHKPWIRN